MSIVRNGETYAETNIEPETGVAFSLSSIGLSGTPTYSEIISAMRNYGIRLLILRPADTSAITGDSNTWGGALFIDPSGTANANAFFEVVMSSSKIKLFVGGYWNSTEYIETIS